MGMYNELNNIKRAVDQQAVEMKKTQEQQRRVEYVKNELKSMLQNELMDFEDIFCDDIKAIAIENVLNNTIVLLYNKDYTRQFLNEKYYQVARQVEQIKKKTEIKDDYKKQIALEKWEIQKERERLKMQLEAEKLKQAQQKQYSKAKCQAPALNVNCSGIAKVFIFIMFAPFAIFGLIIYGFISAAAKSK